MTKNPEIQTFQERVHAAAVILKVPPFLLMSTLYQSGLVELCAAADGEEVCLAKDIVR